FDRVLALLVERDLLPQLLGLAVDPDAREALLGDLLEKLRVLAFAAAHERREQLDPRSLGQLRDRIDDLLARLRADLAPALVTMRRSDARVKQAQIIVNFGDGADRRTRIARGRLLIDRDRGREALDVVDVGLLHLPQELPSVRRQGADVAALPFRIDLID